MKTTRKQPGDPVLAEIEQELVPGRFVRYDDMYHFVRHLHQVEAKLKAMIDEGDAERAVGLYEAFLAGCYEKIEECDDSGASLSMFWHCIFCGWVQARQAAGYPAADTVQQILNWKKNDNYGFCFEIEKEVVKVLDPEAYEVFVSHYCKLVDDGLAGLQGRKPGVIFEYDNRVRLPAMSLKDIYQAKGDAASYAALCERIGLSPQDCEHLAEMEQTKRRWKQALEWVEKGLALEPTRNWHNESAIMLDHMKPEILSRLGRKEDAFAQSWDDFEKYPSEAGYEAFMRYVPKGEKTKWHERAMEVATDGDVGSFMELCVKTKEWTRLAARVLAAKHDELEAVSHYYSATAAAGLVKRDAPAAAKLYRAMGFRILNAKKSKYRGNALANFESARDLYRKAGLESEWAVLVTVVRAEHSRKYGFMPGFERLAAGESTQVPSLAERVKARWATQVRNEKP